MSDLGTFNGSYTDGDQQVPVTDDTLNGSVSSQVNVGDDFPDIHSDVETPVTLKIEEYREAERRRFSSLLAPFRSAAAMVRNSLGKLKNIAAAGVVALIGTGDGVDASPYVQTNSPRPVASASQDGKTVPVSTNAEDGEDGDIVTEEIRKQVIAQWLKFIEEKNEMVQATVNGELTEMDKGEYNWHKTRVRSPTPNLRTAWKGEIRWAEEELDIQSVRHFPEKGWPKEGVESREMANRRFFIFEADGKYFFIERAYQTKENPNRTTDGSFIANPGNIVLSAEFNSFEEAVIFSKKVEDTAVEDSRQKQ